MLTSLVRAGGSLENDAAHTQIILIAIRDSVAVSDGDSVDVEAASGVDSDFLVGGADLDVVAEDADAAPGGTSARPSTALWV